jgi:hypothetical protein
MVFKAGMCGKVFQSGPGRNVARRVGAGPGYARSRQGTAWLDPSRSRHGKSRVWEGTVRPGHGMARHGRAG